MSEETADNTKTSEDSRSEVERQSAIKAAMEIFAYVKPYSRWFWPAMVAVFITSGLALVFPYMMGSLIGGSLEKGVDVETLQSEMNRTAIILLSVLALQAFIAYWRIRWFATAVEQGVADMRKETFSRLIRLPMSFFGERRVGELTSRLASDLETIRDTFAMTVPQFIRQSVIFLIGLVFIFVTSVKLTLFMLGTLPVIILAVAIFGRRIRGLSRKSQDELAASNVVVEESLQGIADVKAFSNEDFEANRYRGALGGFVQTALRTASARALFVSFIIFALMGAITVVVWFGAGMVRDGTLSPREFAKFVFFSIFIGTALGSFPEIMSQVQKTVGAADRVREILRDEPEDTSDRDVSRGRLKGALELRDVSFAYPSRKDISVLDKVSLAASSGERIALVGPSGAGKSTVINLLLRFYEPTSGAILFDGEAAAGYPLGYLRSQMAIVPQEVMLFGGSIRENIAYGKIGANDDLIIDAAKRANAHEFIESFPEGYETAVGERGVKLSGGQRQRIAIARAILADPAILILDEATSSLDSESERLVQEALEGLMKDRTSVIIAHRLATIRNCDRIVVLHEGKVVETGSHEELVANPEGLYRMLAELQFQ